MGHRSIIRPPGLWCVVNKSPEVVPAPKIADGF